MADEKTNEEVRVAPVDESYVASDEEHEPVILRSADTPSFPAPVGIDPDTLREQAVGHLYYGVGNDDQQDSGKGVFQDEPKAAKGKRGRAAADKPDPDKKD